MAAVGLDMLAAVLEKRRNEYVPGSSLLFALESDCCALSVHPGGTLAETGGKCEPSWHSSLATVLGDGLLDEDEERLLDDETEWRRSSRRMLLVHIFD